MYGRLKMKPAVAATTAQTPSATKTASRAAPSGSKRQTTRPATPIAR